MEFMAMGAVAIMGHVLLWGSHYGKFHYGKTADMFGQPWQRFILSECFLAITYVCVLVHSVTLARRNYSDAVYITSVCCISCCRNSSSCIISDVMLVSDACNA